MSRFRETRSVIVTLETGTEDELHLLYQRDNLLLREKYLIDKGDSSLYDIGEAFNTFIKLILKYELDIKPSDDELSKYVVNHSTLEDAHNQINKIK